MRIAPLSIHSVLVGGREKKMIGLKTFGMFVKERPNLPDRSAAVMLKAIGKQFGQIQNARARLIPQS